MQPTSKSVIRRLGLTDYKPWVAFGLFWLPFLVFVGIASEILENENLPFDIPLLRTIHAFATPWLDRAVELFTNLGGIVFILPVFMVLVGWLYLKHHYRAVKQLVFIVGGAGVANVLLKLFFHRQRPSLWQALVHEQSFSFPSGHAMASSALAFGIMAVCWRTKWRWWSVVLGLLFIVFVGFTRLYLGVHYPSDIIGGWTVSLFWALLVYKIIK